MALEQPNNQPQPMAQRPPVGDGGEAMPNQGDAMPNQQAQGQDQGQNQEQQIQEFQQRVQQLSPQEKQVLSQSLTPDFRDNLLIYWNLESRRRNQLLNLCHSHNRQWLKGEEKVSQTGHPNNHKVGEWFNDHNPSSSAPSSGRPAFHSTQ
jgi:hypothetical protein